jgi:hypothetical protein
MAQRKHRLADIKAEADRLREFLDDQSVELDDRTPWVSRFEWLLEEMSLIVERDLHNERVFAQVGWAPIHSEILGETIIAIRDQAVEVPDRFSDLQPYTRHEAELLDGLSDDHIRESHQIKKVFGGRIASSRPSDDGEKAAEKSP